MQVATTIENDLQKSQPNQSSSQDIYGLCFVCIHSYIIIFC